MENLIFIKTPPHQNIHRIATDGQSWAQAFSRENSGTYNNEFMIVDYNKFTPASSSSLPSGLLTVLEQLPGTITFNDMTAWVQQHGYWASYNRIFFDNMADLGNQSAMIDSFGDHYSWENTSRAVLFRQLQAGVTDEISFRKAMRYNRFQSDSISMQGCSNSPSASNAISERGDLTANTAGCIADIAFQNEAGIDAKYTSAAQTRRQKMEGWAQNGLTHDDQPPFVWSTGPFANHSHVGMPDTAAFDWTLMAWK